VRALLGLLRKEVRHIARDRQTAAVLLLLPVVQVMLFGFAIRTDVNDVRLAIVDPAPDAVTLALRARFTGGNVFQTVAVTRTTNDLTRLFADGTAQQAIVFEPGFGERLGRGESPQLLIVSDATEPNTGALLQAYAESVVQSFEQSDVKAISGSRGPPATQTSMIVPQVRLRFNPTRASVNLFVPGLMAFVLTIVASLMTAVSLAREKETGTLEALLVSPLRPWAIIVGKVIPYLVLGFISVITVLIEARLVFRVPVVGNVALLIAEGGLYILVSLSLGILISARTSSQRMAMMTALLVTMLPNLLLSGFVFPLESMPVALRVASNVVPGRWFVAIARGIMLKGIGLHELWRETTIMAVLATVLLVASMRSFSERLE